MQKLLTFLLLGLVFSAALARRERRQDVKDAEVADDEVEDPEEGGEDEVEEEEFDVAKEIKQRVPLEDPCKKKKCYRGEYCVINEKRQASCVCIPACGEEVDPRYWVCSTKNKTYNSECHVDRDHCLCKRGLPGCSDKRMRKIQLDYFGECRALTKCPDHEFEEFPIRMKKWLFIVMQQLALRDELGKYLDLLESAKEDVNHTDAVIWKFCDLDKSPQDRQVSRREIQYIVQSLKALEHCLVPFLDMCDQNSNRRISLVEWGTCLGLGKDHITNKCKDIRSKAKRN